MDKTNGILEEAQDLLDNLGEVETIYLDDDVIDKLRDCFDPVEEGKKYMTPIELEWYELIERFQEEVDAFIQKFSQ